MSELAARPFHHRVMVLERNKVYQLGGWLLVLAGWGYFCAAPVGGYSILAMWIAMAGSSAVRKAWQNWRPRRTLANVETTEQGVLVDGRLRVLRSAIVDGFFQPRWEGDLRSSVRLVGRYRRVIFECEVDHEEQALSLLQALDLSPEKRRAEFNAESLLLSSPALFAFVLLLGVGSIAAFFALFLFGLPLVQAHPLLPAFFLTLVNVLWLAMVPSTIAVGTDGVLTRWLWQRRFIPMDDIVGAAAQGPGQISLRRASGKDTVLDISGQSKAGSAGRLAQQKRDAVLARITEAHRTFEAKNQPTNTTALLRKGARETKEWLAALRRLEQVGNYRDSVLREDALWQVFENPSAPDDARAGALLLLRKTLDGDGKSRVRVASDAAVSPKLRIALDAISEEADSAYEEALSSLVEG
jgi:hypothetical protein